MGSPNERDVGAQEEVQMDHDDFEIGVAGVDEVAWARKIRGVCADEVVGEVLAEEDPEGVVRLEEGRISHARPKRKDVSRVDHC